MPPTEADPKEAAAAAKEFEGYWGAASSKFEDSEFDREGLPVLEGKTQLTFGEVTGWKHASDWVEERRAAMEAESPSPEGLEEGTDGEDATEPSLKLVVVSVVGPSEQEKDRLRLSYYKPQEKKLDAESATSAEGAEAPEPEEGEEEGEEGDRELEAALSDLQHEADRRIRGFEINQVEGSMEWLAGLLGMMVSIRAEVPKGEYLWETIYPQTKQGVPEVSPNGKYLVKMWAYGEWRSVIVDDCLPFGPDGLPLLLRSMGTEHEVELWPLLLSKAALKLYGKRSDGHPLSNAMAYGSAITGKSFQMSSAGRIGVGFESLMKESCADESRCVIGLVASSMDGAVQPELQPGIDPIAVHTVCDHRVSGQNMAAVSLLRLETTRSQFLERQLDSTVKLKPAGDTKGGAMRETDLESKFLQIAATVDWMAEMHSVPGILSSFWISSTSVLPMFPTVIKMFSTQEMAHHAALEHTWPDTTVPPVKSPTMALFCDTDTPTDLVCTFWQLPTTWEAPSEETLDENKEEDGDAPAPEPPAEPPMPRLQASGDKWDWKSASARPVARAETALAACTTLKIAPGRPLVRLNIDAALGYVASIASGTGFVAGDLVSVLKESVGLSCVERVEAPLAAVETQTAQVVMRLKIQTTSPSRVAAFIDLSDGRVEDNLKLSLLNNTKSESTSYMSLFMPAVTMEPTEEGYTLMLDASSRYGKPSICASTATVYVLSEEEGITATLDNFEHARKSTGDQELNLSKDTVLLKYVLQPADVMEVGSLELHVTGTERQVEMRLLDTHQQPLQTVHGENGHCVMMYVPLKQSDGEQSWTLFVNVLAPNLEVAAREAEVAKAEEESGVRCHWELVVRSRSQFPILIDTRRQDMSVQLKAQWEDADKGRAERAKRARDSYLTPVPGEGDGEVDSHRAVEPVPPVRVNAMDQTEAFMLTEALRKEQLEGALKVQEEFDAEQSGLVELRGAAATKWAEGNEARVVAWEEVKTGVEQHWEETSQKPRNVLRTAFKAE
eukprot:TRINITY_DN1232_c0_g2_i2.p1 TRINITY_DN1232_c0_g2~~TRINITY_DN1232_c0_g2_i2.p1  ORF type:complete len:1011 (+),score=265.44 TRINITY_DN1232_c0_g2_i2:315-3347(+)